MNRGSRILRHALEARPRSFNEAPIHESGKLDKAARLHGLHCRFNEAPIHESGK